MISIIMPSFNQATFLDQSIQSVRDQDCEDLELIVVDGGSTDGSVAVLQRHADFITDWTSEPDDGPVHAINKGLARARGDFVAVLPADDLLAPNALRRRLKVFESRPDIDFVYGDYEVIDSAGRRLSVRVAGAPAFDEWVRTCTMPIALQSSMWRACVLGRVGFWDVARGVASDWDFFLKVGVRCHMFYLPGTGGQFRYHPQSDSATQQLDWARLVPKMYEELFADSELPPSLQTLKTRALASAHLYSAFSQMSHGTLKETIRSAFRAVASDPKIVLTKRFMALCVLGALGARLRNLYHSSKGKRGWK